MTNTTLRGQGVMAPTRSGTSAKQKPRGVNPGMDAGGEGPLSQISNIITFSSFIFYSELITAFFVGITLLCKLFAL